MTDLELYQRLARIEERAAARDEKLNSMSEKIDEMYEAFVRSKGAWWALSGAAMLGGAIIGLIFKYIPLPR